MADKGTIGHGHGAQSIHFPREASRRGTLSITGTAQVNEVAGRTRLSLHTPRSMAVQVSVNSAADGSFAFYNLAAGRYMVAVYGQQDYLPGIYAVDVS